MHLLIGKDKEEIRRILESLLRENKDPVFSFYPDTFSLDAFFQEVETLPFLSKKKVVILYELDQLQEKDFKSVQCFVENPNAWISLYLTANDLASQTKFVKLFEKKGQVHRFKEEKPWEREKRLSEWLMEEARLEGVTLSYQAAANLVQSTSENTLKTELQKLMCFVYGKKSITQEDIAQLCTPSHHETVWHLSDALLASSATQASKIGAALLDSGLAIFPLLAGLRSQFVIGLDLLELGKEGAKKYPYLKGAFLEKKMQMFKKYGLARLNYGLLSILETELKAKNSVAESSLLLELLINKLCYDTLSFSQPIGTS